MTPRFELAIATGAVLFGVVVAFWWLQPEAQRMDGARSEGPFSSAAPALPQAGESARESARGEGVKSGTSVGAMATDDFKAALADARHFCVDLLSGVAQEGMRDIYAGRQIGPPECVAALDRLFLREVAADTSVPLSRPMTWGDLFNDVSEDIEAVLDAIQRQECVARPDDIRPDLSQECSARHMAEVDRLRSVCGRVFSSALGQDWRDESVPPFVPEYTTVPRYWNYRSSAATRLRLADEIAAFSQGITEEPNGSGFSDAPPRTADPDGRTARMAKHDRMAGERRRARYEAIAAQERQFPGQRLDRLDETFFRTVWLASQCAPHYPILRWMADRPEQFQGLMGRAASLGDEFALADRLASRQQAEQLMDTNPMQALLHLAQLEGQAIDREWEEEDKEFRRKAMLPHFGTRRALLALAGIECEEPCAEADLYALEQERARDLELWRRSCSMKMEACAERPRLDALESQLWDVRTRLNDTKAERSLPYRKRRETAKLRRVLTAEALAARYGVTLNRDALYEVVVNPNRLEALTEDELADIRFEAEGMADAIRAQRDHAGGS